MYAIRCVISVTTAMTTTMHADHTKALLIRFSGTRGMRVVVLTSNLDAGSLYGMAQAAWWQDFPCKVADMSVSCGQPLVTVHFYAQDAASPSTSDMQQQLERYTRSLNLPASQQQTALDHLAAIDFSSARAHLVASVPGTHSGRCWFQWRYVIKTK